MPPTFTLPEPFAAEKSVSVYGAVNVTVVPLAKNKWFLTSATNVAPITSAGASSNT